MHFPGAEEEVETWSVSGSVLSSRPPCTGYTTPLSCLGGWWVDKGQEGKQTRTEDSVRNLHGSKVKDVECGSPSENLNFVRMASCADKLDMTIVHSRAFCKDKQHWNRLPTLTPACWPYLPREESVFLYSNHLMQGGMLGMPRGMLLTGRAGPGAKKQEEH